MEKKRPTSVTVIAWFLIVVAAINVVTMTFAWKKVYQDPKVQELMAKSPLPVSVQYAMGAVGLVVMLTAGIFMLRGKNWARFLYMGWTAAGFVISFFTSPAKLMLIPGVVMYAIVVFFLMRPAANAYFESAADVDEN